MARPWLWRIEKWCFPWVNRGAGTVRKTVFTLGIVPLVRLELTLNRCEVNG